MIVIQSHWRALLIIALWQAWKVGADFVTPFILLKVIAPKVGWHNNGFRLHFNATGCCNNHQIVAIDFRLFHIVAAANGFFLAGFKVITIQVPAIANIHASNLHNSGRIMITDADSCHTESIFNDIWHTDFIEHNGFFCVNIVVFDGDLLLIIFNDAPNQFTVVVKRIVDTSSGVVNGTFLHANRLGTVLARLDIQVDAVLVSWRERRAFLPHKRLFIDIVCSMSGIHRANFVRIMDHLNHRAGAVINAYEIIVLVDLSKDAEGFITINSVAIGLIPAHTAVCRNFIFDGVFGFLGIFELVVCGIVKIRTHALAAAIPINRAEGFHQRTKWQPELSVLHNRCRRQADLFAIHGHGLLPNGAFDDDGFIVIFEGKSFFVQLHIEFHHILQIGLIHHSGAFDNFYPLVNHTPIDVYTCRPAGLRKHRRHNQRRTQA